MIQLSWLGSKLQTSTCLLLPSAGITHVCLHSVGITHVYLHSSGITHVCMPSHLAFAWLLGSLSSGNHPCVADTSLTDVSRPVPTPVLSTRKIGSRHHRRLIFAVRFHRYPDFLLSICRILSPCSFGHRCAHTTCFGQLNVLPRYQCCDSS